MYFIYTDETGTSFGKNNLGFYSDGMFFMYGGLCINIQNYHLIEEAFKDLCKDILNIDNIYDKEIHSGNIFKRNKGFEYLQEEQMFSYFDEILQLLSKFNIPLIVGVSFKEAKIFGDLAERENKLKLLASSIYSFLNLTDYFLCKNNSRGIIIADEISEKKYRDINYLLYKENLFGKNGGIKIDLLMNRIFFEKLKRFKENEIEPIIKLKYNFESKIYSILDNIHFVKSNLSPFIQLTDTVLFLLNILFEYFYLKVEKKLNIYEETKYREKLNLLKYLEKSIGYFFSRNKYMGFLDIYNNNYDIRIFTSDHLPVDIEKFILELRNTKKVKNIGRTASMAYTLYGCLPVNKFYAKNI